MAALEAIEDWPVPTVAAAVVGPSGILAQHGDIRHRFELASVTKPLAARAAQVAIEEGVVELDTGHHPFLSQPAAVRDLVLSTLDPC